MKTDSLIKRFLAFSVGGYINIFIGLITLPITTRMLSPEEYGISSLIDVVVQILVISTSLSMEQGFVRFFYEEENEDRGKLLYSTFFPFIILGTIAFIFIFLFREKLTFFVLGRKENFLWIYFILAIFFRTVNIFSFLIIRMKQRAKLYSTLTVLIKLLEFLFILLLFQYFGNNYKTLIYSILFSNIIIAILSIIVEKKIWNLKNFLFRHDCKTKPQVLFRFSSPLVLTMALNWVFASMDKISIKMFSDLNEVGIYSGAFKIVALLSVIQSGFSTFWTPTALEHYSKYPDDRSFYEKINRYLSFVFFLLGINILMFRNIIGMVLGKQFILSIFVMPTLIFVPIMYLLSETTMIGISLRKKTEYFLYVSIASAACNFIGNVILVPYLGARGAAISTGISYIVFFSLRTYFSIKLINFNFYLKKIYSVIFLMLIYALYLTFYNNIYFTIIFGFALEVIVLLIYFPTLKEIYSQFIKKARLK